MKIFRSMAALVAAGGLMLGTAGPVSGQQGSGQGTSPSATQGPGSGQGSGQTNSPSSGQRNGTQPTLSPMPGMGPDDLSREPSKLTDTELDNVRNGERQKKLIADTEKLLTLANELKLDVDKSTKNMLSLDVIRKADEIEKLAHSVKEKMKGT